jgi:hypothetical protein
MKSVFVSHIIHIQTDPISNHVTAFLAVAIEKWQFDIEVLNDASSTQAERHRFVEHVDHPEDVNLAVAILYAVVFHGRVSVIAEVLAQSGGCRHHDITLEQMYEVSGCVTYSSYVATRTRETVCTPRWHMMIPREAP